MKKLILIALIFISFAGFSQEKLSYGLTHIPIDLSTITGADTTIYRSFYNLEESRCWSARISWTGLTGAGTVDYQVAMRSTGFESYNGLSQVVVTATTGDDGGKEDCIGNWPFFAIKITKGTLSAGTLSWDLNITKR